MNYLQRIIARAALALPAIALFASCDSTGEIGSALVQSDSQIYVVDSFTLSGKTVKNDRVPSRSVMQLIGSLRAEGYGTFSSDYVTQLFPAQRLDSLITSSNDIDSVKMLLMFKPGKFVGDSVIPLGLDIYRLDKQLEAPIFSDFSPQGYYNPATGLLGSTVYCASSLELPTDSLRNLSYREIYVDMPQTLGQEMYDIYTQHPEAVNSPTAFAKYFPGIYVKNTYGSGRVTEIAATSLQLYYHYTGTTSEGNDTVYNSSRTLLLATPEVISNNILNYNPSSAITSAIAAGQQLVVAPDGYDVEMTFPLPAIIDNYRTNTNGNLAVVNDLLLTIPASVIANDYGIEPPAQLLMVLKSDYDKFFEESQVTNSITSFFGTYSAATHSYEFNSLRSYLLDALDREATLTPTDYTFILTPATVATESIYSSSSSSYVDYVSQVTPYIERPAMVRLDLPASKITLTYSTQKLH